MFDADAFLGSVVTGSNSTKVIPCPVGEFPGVIDKIAARQWQSKDGTKTGVALDVTWSVEDDAAKQATGRENVTVRQGLMLTSTQTVVLTWLKERTWALVGCAQPAD